jgi:hypothetical protein
VPEPATWQPVHLAQTADDAAGTPTVSTTTAPTTNPNVSVDTSPVDDPTLVVESNPGVIASVSARGGFAFARSDDIVAVTGPDGASIVQADSFVPPGTSPPPPPTSDLEPTDDGGNNDIGFTS